MGLIGILRKIFFYCFNIAFGLAGIAIMIVSIIAVADEEALKNMLNLIPGIEEISEIVDLVALFTNFAVTFIVLGIAMAIIGTLGFFGAMCDSKCSLILYMALVGLIVTAEVVIIIMLVEYPETFSQGAQDLFRKQFDNIEDCHTNVTDDGTMKLLCSNEPISLGWNSMQFDMQCCGVANYLDYNDTNIVTWFPRNPISLAPATCCRHDKQDKLGQGGSVDPANTCYNLGSRPDGYNKQGCVDTLIEWMVTSPWFIGIMIGVGIVELLLLLGALNQLCRS